MVVAPASAIYAALSEAAADTRLSSLAPRLRAAADALGQEPHTPQRFEAVVIDAAGGALATGADPADAAAAAAQRAAQLAAAQEEDSSLRRMRSALTGSGGLAGRASEAGYGMRAGSRVLQSSLDGQWPAGGAAGGHLQAGNLGGRGRGYHSRLDAPHMNRAPQPV